MNNDTHHNPDNNDTPPAPRPIAFDPARRDLGVMVGFDGSKQSVLALHYGALAAQRSGRVLTVVTAFSVPRPIHTALPAGPEKSEATTQLVAAQEVLQEARKYLQEYPGKVIYRTERGDAAGVLVDLSTVAELAVVGSRGRGGFFGRVLGSVSSALPAHSDSPTAVIPRHYKVPHARGTARFMPQSDQRPIIVGIDGSQHSRVAVLHAAQAAQNRGVTLNLLLALPPLEGSMSWYPELDTTEQELIARRQPQLERSLQAEALWVNRHYPSLTVTTRVEPADPITQLSKATHKAQLTVLGTQGRTEYTGAHLGSISRAVLLRAAGPVMVVPNLQDDRLNDQPPRIR